MPKDRGETLALMRHVGANTALICGWLLVVTYSVWELGSFEHGVLLILIGLQLRPTS